MWKFSRTTSNDEFISKGQTIESAAAIFSLEKILLVHLSFCIMSSAFLKTKPHTMEGNAHLNFFVCNFNCKYNDVNQNIIYFGSEEPLSASLFIMGIMAARIPLHHSVGGTNEGKYFFSFALR